MAYEYDWSTNVQLYFYSMEDSTQSFESLSGRAQAQRSQGTFDEAPSDPGELSDAGTIVAERDVEPDHANPSLPAHRRLLLTMDSKEATKGIVWFDAEHERNQEFLRKSAEYKSMRVINRSAGLFSRPAITAPPTEKTPNEQARRLYYECTTSEDEFINDGRNLLGRFTSLANADGTEIERSHTLVDSGMTRRENGRDSGQNPFRDALLYIIPIWMNDYDPDGEGFVNQTGYVPLYKIGNFLETDAFLGLLDRWMIELLHYDRN